MSKSDEYYAVPREELETIYAESRTAYDYLQFDPWQWISGLTFGKFLLLAITGIICMLALRYLGIGLQP